MADGFHVRRHIGLPQRSRVVENAGVLDVLAGIDGRTRRRADAGRGLMIGESDAVLFDPLTAGHRHRPALEEVLLVHQDEQNVVAAGRRGGSDHRRGRCGRHRLLRRCNGLRPHCGRPEHGRAAGDEHTTGGIAPVTQWIFHLRLRTRAGWTAIGPIQTGIFKIKAPSNARRQPICSGRSRAEGSRSHSGGRRARARLR